MAVRPAAGVSQGRDEEQDPADLQGRPQVEQGVEGEAGQPVPSADQVQDLGHAGQDAEQLEAHVGREGAQRVAGAQPRPDGVGRGQPGRLKRQVVVGVAEGDPADDEQT